MENYPREYKRAHFFQKNTQMNDMYKSLNDP